MNWKEQKRESKKSEEYQRIIDKYSIINEPIPEQHNSKFHHLNAVHQSYSLHFMNSMTFAKRSMSASFYFFIHAFYPDIHQSKASDIISKLNKDINC